MINHNNFFIQRQRENQNLSAIFRQHWYRIYIMMNRLKMNIINHFQKTSKNLKKAIQEQLTAIPEKYIISLSITLDMFNNQLNNPIIVYNTTN